MANYISDRAFTDHIHNNVATPKVYKPIDWVQVLLNPANALQIDMFDGIDYVFTKDGITKTVQERFRERKYERYSDFTIRYRRDNNEHTERHQSEYYKMKADYLTYGITNCLKDNLPLCTDFLKFAIIDLRLVYAHIDSGDIVILNNGKGLCKMVNHKIECPIKYNTDGSSSFFPIEIAFLIELWGKEIIVAQKGFV